MRFLALGKFMQDFFQNIFLKFGIFDDVFVTMGIDKIINEIYYNEIYGFLEKSP